MVMGMSSPGRASAMACGRSPVSSASAITDPEKPSAVPRIMAGITDRGVVILIFMESSSCELSVEAPRDSHGLYSVPRAFSKSYEYMSGIGASNAKIEAWLRLGTWSSG